MSKQPDNKRWEELERVFDKLGAVESIVEIGVMRAESEQHRIGDGHATQFFYEYVKQHPETTYLGIDCDAHAIELCKRRFGDANMVFVCGDAASLLPPNAPDLLYLDGGDNPSEAVFQFLSCPPQRCVVIDDTYQKAIPDYPAQPFYWIGKGAGLVTLLEALEWAVEYNGNGMIACFR